MKTYNITEQEYLDNHDLYILGNMIEMSGITKEDHGLIWETKRKPFEIY